MILPSTAGDSAKKAATDATIELMGVFETEGLVPGVDPEVLSTQIRSDLSQVLSEPLGSERLEALKQLGTLAHKHGLDAVEADVRLEIVWDALESGDTEYALATFSWILQEIAHGSLTPSDNQTRVIASQMLQVPVLTARHPGVSTQLIESLTFWMEHFAAKADIPLHSRWITRHQVELGLGHREEAREALDIIAALEEVPRQVEDESDCPLHHFRSRIAWAVNSSEYPQALALYRDALERTSATGWQCIQPDDIDPLLMLPLSWAGEGDAAWRAHERSYRHQSETSQYLGDIASHLRYCAATWNIAEGLEILKNHAHWFSNPEDSWDLLVAARSGATFLSRAVSAYVGTATPIPALGYPISGENRWFSFESLCPSDTLVVAQTRLSQVAQRLALIFDARNANNTISTRIRDNLHEAPLCSFASVKNLLKARFSAQTLLEKHGISEDSAAWVLPPEADPSWQRQPVPEYSTLDFATGESTLRAMNDILAEVNFDALPPEISARKESLVLHTDRVALLGAAGRWSELIDVGESLLEIAELLDDHRQSLRLACYLVQSYWQLGDLASARNWLVRADAFNDATVVAKPRALLEDLALLAG